MSLTVINPVTAVEMSRLPPATDLAGVQLIGYDQDNPPEMVRVPASTLQTAASSPTTAADITDASAAGRNLLTAADAKAQAALLGRVLAMTTSDFTKTADTALANVPGLSITVVAGVRYYLNCALHITPDATGQAQIAVSGTATVSEMALHATRGGATGSVVNLAFITALNAALNSTTTTAAILWLRGSFLAVTSGTITIQFAQLVASGASVMESGSVMRPELFFG